MAKECTLEIRDEVNTRFTGLDVGTRRKLKKKLEFLLPYARHTPAFRLGRWDGMMRFCDVGARSYFHLLDDLLPIIYDAGYVINIDDQRHDWDFEFEEIDKDSYSHVIWPEGHKFAGQPVEFHDHQVEFVNLLLSSPQGVAEVPTAGGKTICTAVLSDKIGKYGRSIVIVPRKGLVTQTEKEYKNVGLDVGVYFGDRKEVGRQHTICTWQSLEALDKKSKHYDADFPLEEFLKDVVGVIIDETHGAAAAVLRKLLSGPFASVPIRWGLTGTIPPEEYLAIAIKAVVGPLLGEISARELQDRGVMANLHIDVLQLIDNADLFTNYPSELKWLTTNKRRLKFIANLIAEKAAADGNTLVLVDRIVTGEMLAELIPDSVFIHGIVKNAKREEAYDEINEMDNKVIIATYGVAGTGIDIPRLFNVFLFEVGKSFIRVIQTIGRGLRTAKDKDFANIYDICSNSKYSKRHLTARKKIYKQRSYPFKVTKVPY